MAAKKKTKRQQHTKSKKTGRSKMKPAKSAKKKAVKKVKFKKALATKKSAQKRAGIKTKPAGRKAIGAKTVRKLKKPVERKSQSVVTVAFPREDRGTSSGQQSGDLQGLSRVEGADSESVDELLEEGNAFEADVVTGVEAAGDAEEREVHSHEVLQDDVPDEYLDKD